MALLYFVIGLVVCGLSSARFYDSDPAQGFVLALLSVVLLALFVILALSEEDWKALRTR